MASKVSKGSKGSSTVTSKEVKDNDDIQSLRDQVAVLTENDRDLRERVATLERLVESLTSKRGKNPGVESRPRQGKGGTILEKVLAKHQPGKFVSLKNTLTPIKFSDNNEKKGNVFMNVLVDGAVVANICYIPDKHEQVAMKEELEKYATLVPFETVTNTIRTELTEKTVVVEEDV